MDWNLSLVTRNVSYACCSIIKLRVCHFKLLLSLMVYSMTDLRSSCDEIPVESTSIAECSTYLYSDVYDDVMCWIQSIQIFRDPLLVQQFYQSPPFRCLKIFEASPTPLNIFIPPCHFPLYETLKLIAKHASDISLRQTKPNGKRFEAFSIG